MKAVLLGLILFVGLVRGAEPVLAANGIKTSAFDSSGHLIRHFFARSAIGPIDAPILDDGKVDFFSVASADAPVAVLTFERAQYVRRDETVAGDKIAKLETKEGSVQGVGFTCALDTGVLDLKSEVHCTNEQFEMTGDWAKISFAAKGERENGIVREIKVEGRVVIRKIATAAAPFDRAETSRAEFSAANHKIVLTTPVMCWKGQEKVVTDTTSGGFEILLDDTPSRANAVMPKP